MNPILKIAEDLAKIKEALPLGTSMSELGIKFIHPIEIQPPVRGSNL